MGNVGGEGGFTDAADADDRDQAGVVGGDPFLEGGGFGGSVNEGGGVWYFAPVVLGVAVCVGRRGNFLPI